MHSKPTLILLLTSALLFVNTTQKLSASKKLEQKTAVVDVKQYDSSQAIDLEEIKERKVVVEESEDSQKPFVSVEQMPQYKGGDKAMYKFIEANLKYSEEALEQGIEGRVILGFVVGKTGDISDIQIIRSLHPKLDREAIRVVKAMPKWIAGKQNSRNVPVYYTLPIRFKLPSPIQIEVKEVTANPTNAVDIADLKEHRVVVEDTEGSDKPFVVVEQMPQYEGGESAMYSFIASHLKYPKTAQKEGIQGRVMLRFVVGKTGSVSDVQILRGVDPSIDQEAMRVVRAMPKWIPGKQNGKNVAVYFTLPLVFRLKEDKASEPVTKPVK